MTSNGRKIDVKTVERYLDGLMESFIIYQARRYNIRGKQYLKTLEKYYVVDIGMRYMLLGTRGTDVGHILENVIYLELKRRGYEVYVHIYWSLWKRRYIYANDLRVLREKEDKLLKDQLDGLDVYAAGNADLNFCLLTVIYRQRLICGKLLIQIISICMTILWGMNLASGR